MNSLSNQQISEYQHSIFNFSCKNGKEEDVIKLVNKINNQNNNYPINKASKYGHYNIVKILIDNKFKVTKKSVLNSYTNKYYEITKFLIKNGGDVHLDNDFLIRDSCENNNIEMVEFLINHDVNIHIHDECCLITSIEKNYEILSYLLIDKNANVHINDDYPLKLAYEKNHYHIMKKIILKDEDYYKNNKKLALIYNFYLLINHIDYNNIDGINKILFETDIDHDDNYAIIMSIYYRRYEIAKILYENTKNKEKLIENLEKSHIVDREHYQFLF